MRSTAIARTSPSIKSRRQWILFSKNSMIQRRQQRLLADLMKRTAAKDISNGKDFFNPYSSKFGTIKEGDVSGKSFKRLHRFRYSPTVWYGNNEVHLHPWKRRRLSVREALRLQTVPDSYVMPEDVPLCAKFKVIGNGVPCLLAQKLAEAVSAFIETNQRAVRPAAAVRTMAAASLAEARW